MNEEQIKSLIEQLKAAGLEEEQIMDVFYETFTKGKMDRKDLEALANAMGYELTDEFKEDSHEDPIAAPAGEEGIGDLSKEDLEEAKEIGPDESKEEFEEKIEDMGEVEAEPEDKAEEEAEPEVAEEDAEEGASESEEAESDEGKDEGAEEDEDEEWEEAQKLFKI